MNTLYVSIVFQLKEGGKASESGQLYVGDYIVSVNDIKCVSLTEAVQLIQSAFRTLTLSIWR